MNGDLWQIALVDMLFLCLAVGMGLWFRAWLAGEQRRMDQRLDALEAVHARLDRVSGRLQAVSNVLEFMGKEGKVKAREEPPTAPSVPTSKREAEFERAWQMLSAGAEPATVAQQLGIGVAEVELMNRMMRYRRQV